MPTTPKFQIAYPDGTSNLTPLQDWFSAIANGVENALNTGLGGAPRLANSDSERAAIFPSPVQGNTVLRPDKGYTEQYFALYNAGTNPAGATPAGWYPVAGVMPYETIKGKTMANVPVSGSVWFLIDRFYFDADSTSGHFQTPGTNYLFRAGLAGRYKIEVQLGIGVANIGSIHALKKNSVTLDTTASVAVQNNTVYGGVGGVTLNAEAWLNAGDGISLTNWFSAGGASLVDIMNWSATARFISPITK
jgi:hypothetical protein